jgi:lipopolysaccharide biosynthesis glycosyltransferase
VNRPLISIVSTADEAYVPHLAAMLHSVFAVTPGIKIDFRFLHHADFDLHALGKLEAFCLSNGAGFRATRVNPELVHTLPATARYRQEAWYRLLLPSLMPDVDRVLWLDADLLILYPIEELWATRLDGKFLAAVPNALGPRHRVLPEKLGIADRRRYFNTGVMLMDLDKMRLANSEKRLREATKRFSEQSRFADQDVINPVFHDNYHVLPLPWNVTTGTYFHAREAIYVHGLKNYIEAIRHPRIVHYTQQKPWQPTSIHPYRDLYLQHRAAAGWPLAPHAPLGMKHRITRHLPMTLHTLLAQPRRLRLGDILIILGLWLARPYNTPQRSAPMRRQ